MYWQELKELIQQLDKKEKGKKIGETFEKLVAKLLELLLEIPLVTAKSGPQPSGDARSMEGKVTVQAKNYSDNSNLRDVEIVGDINITIDHLPNLQLYVLVVSRDISAQLLDKLENIEKILAWTSSHLYCLKTYQISELYVLNSGKKSATSLINQTQIKNSWFGLKK